jgi:hypothetical protein
MGIRSKVSEGYKERLSAKAAERQQRRPGTRVERTGGDLSGIAEDNRELLFAAVLGLLGLAALYLYLQNQKGRGFA